STPSCDRRRARSGRARSCISPWRHTVGVRASRSSCPRWPRKWSGTRQPGRPTAGSTELHRPPSLTTLRALVLLLALALAACQQPVDVSWHAEAGYRWRALRVVTGGRTHFDALTSRRTGLTHRNDVSDEHALANRN